MTHIDPEIQRVQERIADLTRSMKLDWSHESEFVGEIDGYPAMLNVVMLFPLTLTWIFRIQADRDAYANEAETLQSQLREAHALPGETLRFSFEDGYAWLEFFNAEAVDNTTLLEVVADTTAKLDVLGLSLSSGCQKCGATDGVQLLNVQHRPARTCARCIQEAVTKASQADAAPPLPSFPSLLMLAATLCGLGFAWAGVWTGALELVQHFGIQVIEINKLSSVVLMGLVLLAGVPAGMAIGKATRSTELDRTVSPYVTILFVLGFAVVGEYVLVMIWMFRVTGAIDPVGAAAVLPHFFAQYSVLWLVLKGAALATSAITALNYTYIPTTKVEI